MASLKDEETDRQKRAVIALIDYGSREGFTSKKVMKHMRDDGFTVGEIEYAATKIIGD